MNGTVSSSFKLWACLGASGSGQPGQVFDSITLTLTPESSYFAVKQFAQRFTRKLHIPEWAAIALNAVS